MDTKWLEDFVSLAETRSFSRAAQLRHVTQPAFWRPDGDGRLLCALPPVAGKVVSFLSCGSGTCLGRMVELLVKQAGAPLHLDAVCEADRAEAL